MLRVGTYPARHPPSAFSPPSPLPFSFLPRPSPQLAMSGYLAKGWPVSNGREDSRVVQGWGAGRRRVWKRDAKREWGTERSVWKFAEGNVGDNLPLWQFRLRTANHPFLPCILLLPHSSFVSRSLPSPAVRLRSPLRCLSHRISLYSHDNGVDALQVQADAR